MYQVKRGSRHMSCYCLQRDEPIYTKKGCNVDCTYHTGVSKTVTEEVICRTVVLKNH